MCHRNHCSSAYRYCCAGTCRHHRACRNHRAYGYCRAAYRNSGPSPTPGKPITITFVDAWFGVPQFQESVDPVMKAISQKMQAEGVNVVVQGYDPGGL